MKNFFLRLLTGITFVALITAGILISSYTFLCLFSLVIAFCLWEFYGLINRSKRAKVNQPANCVAGMLLCLNTYLYASGTFGYWIFCPYFFYIIATFVAELYRKHQDPLANLAYSFFGQCYIALPLSLLSLLVFQADGTGVYQYMPMLILALFVFIWVNDTGAYVVGVLFGKHRLFERISPKKSWEGFFGGLIFTIASSFVFAHFEPTISYYHWVILSVVVVIFGTWGDLMESLMKRTLEVKDSGNALPGHGGFLDRFDSLLLAVYGMLIYVEVFIRN